MKPDDHVCLCFRVSQRKIVNYLRRENPPVASLISECLGAGTGCGWCVPYLRKLHRQHHEGHHNPALSHTASEYASGRARFRASGQRDDAQPAPDTGPDTPPEGHDRA